MIDQDGGVKWNGLEGKFYWGRKTMTSQGFGDAKEQKTRILVSNFDLPYWSSWNFKRYEYKVEELRSHDCFELSIGLV